MKSAADRALHRRKMFWSRMLQHSSIAVGVLGFSLLAGMLGYRHFEQQSWTDAFVNAAIPYIVEIAVAGLLLAPAIHSLMHRVHWDDPQ